MAASKTATADYWDGVTQAAAGTTNGASVDLRTAYGARFTGKITNGATGPTLGCQVRLQLSADGTNWFDKGGPQVCATGNAAVTPFTFGVDINGYYARLVADSNTDEDVTLDAFVIVTTGI